MLWGWSDSTEGKGFALHSVNWGLVLGTPYGLQHLQAVIPEHKGRSNPWAHLGVTPQNKESKKQTKNDVSSEMCL